MSFFSTYEDLVIDDDRPTILEIIVTVFFSIVALIAAVPFVFFAVLVIAVMLD